MYNIHSYRFPLCVTCVIGLLLLSLNMGIKAQAQPQPQPQLDPNPLQGSWQLVSGQYLNDQQEWVDYESLKLTAIKVISAGHFSFTTMKQGSPQPVFWASGSGRYQLTPSEYTELPTLNSFGAANDAAFTFQYRIEGNLWYTHRVEDDVLKETEIWQRLD